MPANHTQKHEDELLPKYRLDYQKAKPNRFAVSDKSQNLTVVVLQSKQGKAKVYQVKQVRTVILKYQLGGQNGDSL